MDPPSNLMRVDGKRAIGIGVATGSKDDVVAVGNAVADHLAEMEQLFPVGMDLKTIYPENKIADEANNGFILNLIVDRYRDYLYRDGVSCRYVGR